MRPDTTGCTSSAPRPGPSTAATRPTSATRASPSRTRCSTTPSRPAARPTGRRTTAAEAPGRSGPAGRQVLRHDVVVAQHRDPARLLVTVADGGEDRRVQRGQAGRLARPQPAGYGAAADPVPVLVVDERLVHALVDGGEVRVVRGADQGG